MPLTSLTSRAGEGRGWLHFAVDLLKARILRHFQIVAVHPKLRGRIEITGKPQHRYLQ